MNNDILLTAQGDIDISTQDMRLTSSTSQAIAVRLRWIRNEWRYAPSFGLPYYDSVFLKNADKKLIENIIRTLIMRVEGVDSVESVSFSEDRTNRTLNIKFVVNSNESGEVII